MRRRMNRVTALGIAALCSVSAAATDLTLHLKGNEPVKRMTVQFQCDAQATAMGLPSSVFKVEYLNGAGNHLAVVPVKKNSMIFVTVPSGSGAKYAAAQYTWWDAGNRGTTFASDFPGLKGSSSCHRVK